MAVQQKLFRIEQMVGDRRPHAPARPAPTPHLVGAGELAELRQELMHMREAFARNARELAALLNESDECRITRAAGELGAAVDAMEKAADKILQSAEIIDDCAKALTFAQMTDYERGVAQDIQEQVVRIYEACNFQDLTGQRIGKVITTLGLIETRLSEAIEHGGSKTGASQAPASAPVRELINGPRLDGDAGHASQDEIDVMFD